MESGEKARVEGIEGEKWASWLIPGGEDEYKKLSSPELRVQIRRLARRPDALTPTDKLAEFYDQIEKIEEKAKKKGNRAAASEAHQYRLKINERIEALANIEVEAGKKLSGGAEVAEALKNFTPDAFARAMGQANPEEQRALYLRAEETIGAPMQMQLEVPKFLLDPHLSPEERELAQKEWKARAQLATMAFNKRLAPSYDKLFPNQEALDFTGEQLETLMGMKGVVDAASLHLINIAKNRDISGYKIPKPEKVDQYIKSVFEITTGETFALYRGKIREFLREHRGLTEEEAREAEQVAWNLLYSSNVFEEFDETGIPPLVPQLKSQAVWMMMHPQRRLVNKVRSPDEKDKKGKPKTPEAWGVFGEWALNKTKMTGKRLSDDILPSLLFNNALGKIEFGSIDSNLFDILRENGEKLAENPRATITEATGLPWGEIEGPFGNYYFETVSPAIKVFEIIARGPSRDSNVVELGNALRKLEVDPKYREYLLMAWQGIRSKSSVLTPAMGWGDWAIFKRELRKYAPNFFK